VRLRPTGLVELQDLQVSIGNVTATSTVTNIDNTQFRNGQMPSDPGQLTLTGRFSESNDSVTAYTNDPDGDGAPLLHDDGMGGPGDGSITLDSIAGNASAANIMFVPSDGNLQDTFDGYIITVDLTQAPGMSGTNLDATTQLPEVESIATAVANNVSVDSDVMVEMHNTQWAFGGFGGEGDLTFGGEGSQDLSLEAEAVRATFQEYYDPAAGGDVEVNADGELVIRNDGYSGNIGVAGALALMVAGAGDLISKGTTSASSTVSDIMDASVVSNATAVTNNKSVNIEAVTPDDAVFVGDVTQFAYMDATATSNVSNVSITGYENLGLNGTNAEVLNRPIVSSVATAVNNNLSISVSSPGTGQ
jgi:hypothetical protein